MADNLLPDEGVGELFQPASLRLIGEDQLAQGCAVQVAVLQDEVLTEVLGHRREGGPAGLHDDPRGQVRVNHGNALGREHVCGGGFTAADASGYTDDQGHQLRPAEPR